MPAFKSPNSDIKSLNPFILKILVQTIKIRQLKNPSLLKIPIHTFFGKIYAFRKIISIVIITTAAVKKVTI